MRYVYSVLRFVPDAARGEFVNVGAIVGSEETTEWDLRLVSNQRRARALDESGVWSKVSNYIAEIGGSLDAYVEAVSEGAAPNEEVSEGWLLSLSQELRNVVQLSEPRALMAESLEDAVNIVFDEFIIDPGGGQKMQRGQEVTLQSSQGVIRRIVVDVRGEIVLVCREEELRAANAEGREPLSVGFKLSDVVPAEA